MKRKYHSGLIPAGAGAKGSALTPRFQGKIAANAPRTPSATYQAISSRSAKLGKNLISRLAEGLAFQSISSLGGTLIPHRCTSKRCKTMNSVASPGKTATWKPKNRVNVAPVTPSPPRKKTIRGLPRIGTCPVISVPTLVAKKAKVFQGSKYPLKPK